MCDFVSWIEKDNEIYFMDNRALAKYRREHPGVSEIDTRGHYTIKEYFGISGGLNHECMDFTKPGNFHPKIAQAIKAGRMSKHGIFPDGLLLKRIIKKVGNTLKVHKAGDAYNKAGDAYYKAVDAYKKARANECWKLFRIPENRSRVWR